MHKLNNLMKELLVTRPYTYEIMAQIAAKHKEILIEIKAGAPVYLFHGMRENGKTSTIIACMENEDNVARFSDSYRDLKSKVASADAREAFLVDNYPQYISNTGRQQGKRNLEYIVEHGFENPEIPSIIISAEDYIFKDLTDSYRTRMLEIEVPKIESDKKLCEFRDYLVENKDEYISLLNAFSSWHQDRKVKEDMKCMLEEFRARHRKSSKRTVGMVFSYYYFSKMLSQFLGEKFKEKLDMQKLQENCEQLIKWKEGGKKRRQTTLAKILLQRLLEKENVLQVVEPEPDYYCTKYVNGECNRDCGEYPYCRSSNEEKARLYYDPVDLRLGSGENTAILIRNPKQIYQYPKHIGYMNPILIIRSDDLLRLVNIELAAFCYENDLDHESYGPKVLSKELFQNNLCLYHYWNSSHRTYIFDYINLGGKKEKVMLLKLSKGQYEHLKKQAKRPYVLEADGIYETCCRKINELCRHVQSLVGKGGWEDEEYGSN